MSPYSPSKPLPNRRTGLRSARPAVATIIRTATPQRIYPTVGRTNTMPMPANRTHHEPMSNIAENT